MSQKDAILRFPHLCTMGDIIRCGADPSFLRVTEKKNDLTTFTEKRVCETAIPGACPRIQCKKKVDTGDVYMPCRRLHFVESEVNEDGAWVRLPCSTCPEKQDLHPQTKYYVYEYSTKEEKRNAN